MDADFNTPVALSVIFDLAREINTTRSLSQIRGDADTPSTLRGTLSESPPTQSDVDRLRRTLVHLLDVLGVDLLSVSSDEVRAIDPYVDLLLEVRRKLRDIKQWSLADDI